MRDRFRKEMKLSSDEISVFCDQIAMMLNGGIPLHEGTYILYSEMEDKKTKEILRRIDERIKSSAPFYEAIEETNAFPMYMIHMVKIGETSGKLEEVMSSLSAYYERESRVKASIKSAVAYPAVLFAIMSIILLVLVMKILPLFEDMFLELNADIAISSVNMMRFGINTGRTMAIVVSILLVFVMMVILWYPTKKGEIVIKIIFNKLNLFRKLTESMATGKFISAMSLMISSGIETEKTLELASDLIHDPVILKRIYHCKELILENTSIEEALRVSGLLVGMEGRMVTVAAISGAMDTVFAKLGKQYDLKITSELSKISTYLETVLVLVLSVMIGTILISVMLPLVGMLSSIG